jgi:hypothetical protein
MTRATLFISSTFVQIFNANMVNAKKGARWQR